MEMTTDMSQWADGTKHYRIGSKDYAVEATSAENAVPVGAEPMINELLHIIGDGDAPLLAVVRPTVVFECTPEGYAISLTPIRTFPPGTSHEDALAQIQQIQED